MSEGIYIHDSAEVSPKSKIGNNTKIWNLVQIRENVALGASCIISKNVYIDFGVTIGSNVKVQNNVSVYNGVTIEDDVFVGPCVVFTNDYLPRAVAPNWEVTPTLIKKGASLGANCTIICGSTIGEYAMVAAGAVVTKDVPAHTLVAGNPAKPLAFVYKNGNKVEVNHVSNVLQNEVEFTCPKSSEQLRLNKSFLKLLPKK